MNSIQMIDTRLGGEEENQPRHVSPARPPPFSLSRWASPRHLPQTSLHAPSRWSLLFLFAAHLALLSTHPALEAQPANVILHSLPFLSLSLPRTAHTFPAPLPASISFSHSLPCEPHDQLLPFFFLSGTLKNPKGLFLCCFGTSPHNVNYSINIPYHYSLLLHHHHH